MILDNIDPRGDKSLNKLEIKARNIEIFKEIAALQRIMAAEAKHSLLIIFQGMDASGKDGAVRNIFSMVNPSGCNVKSFKKPTEEEFAHDFLWRVHKHAPKKGMIQIFNRSHYEDILVPSVMGYIKDKVIEKRYDQINAFEETLEGNDTTILKFYLHVTKEEQLERLTERIENPLKFWKHNDGDWETRERWDDYKKVYERIFKKCDQPKWHIIPANRNWVKVNAIGEIILKTLKDMHCKYPALETERFKDHESA